jgi:hypothetical protein
LCLDAVSSLVSLSLRFVNSGSARRIVQAANLEFRGTCEFGLMDCDSGFSCDLALCLSITPGECLSRKKRGCFLRDCICGDC